MSVAIGEEAPDFELPSHTGAKVKLSNFRGKKPVLETLSDFWPHGAVRGGPGPTLSA